MIETIYVSGLDGIKVLFDVDNLVFKARVFDQWVKATLLTDLRKKISEKIEGIVSEKYKWIPIIEVEEQTGWGEDKIKCVVGFNADRYYITQQKDKTWLRCDWSIDVTRRSSACQAFRNPSFKFPSSDFKYQDSETRVFYIPYSDAKWEGLKRLSDAIDDLKDKLRELVGTEEGQKKLSAAGGLMIEWRKDNGKVDGAGDKGQTERTG